MTTNPIHVHAQSCMYIIKVHSVHVHTILWVCAHACKLGGRERMEGESERDGVSEREREKRVRKNGEGEPHGMYTV